MVTRDSLKGTHLDLVMHARLTRGGVFFLYRSAADSRLEKTLYREKSGDPLEVRWWVDGYEHHDLDAAIGALNEPERERPPAPTMHKLAATMKDPEITLEMEIAEVARELRERSRVYPRLIEQGSDPDKLGWQTKVLQAVRRRLEALRGERPAAAGAELVADLFERRAQDDG